MRGKASALCSVTQHFGTTFSAGITCFGKKQYERLVVCITSHVHIILHLFARVHYSRRGVATNVDALPFDDTNAWLSLRDPRRDAPGPTLKASDGIRGEGGDDETDDDAQWYPENTDHSAPTTATSAGASTASPRATLVATAGRVVPRPPSRPPATPKLNAPVDTLPPRDSVGRSKSLGRRQVGGLPEWATRRPDQKERSEVGTEAFDGSERAVAWSPLDAAIRPLQAFAAFMQNQVKTRHGLVMGTRSFAVEGGGGVMQTS